MMSQEEKLRDERKKGEVIFEALKNRFEEDKPTRRVLMKIALFLGMTITFTIDPVKPEFRKRKEYDSNDKWGRITFDKFEELINKGDIHDLRKIAELMNVANILNQEKNLDIHTFDRMMKKWYNDQLYKEDTLKGQLKLLKVLQDSRCSLKVVSEVRDTLISYIDNITTENLCEEIESIMGQLEQKISHPDEENLNEFLNTLSDFGVKDLKIGKHGKDYGKNKIFRAQAQEQIDHVRSKSSQTDQVEVRALERPGAATKIISDDYETGLSRLLGEETVELLREIVRKGDIKRHHISGMAAKMDVVNTFDENIQSSDNVVTFDRMLERWYLQHLFSFSPSEAKDELMKVVSASSCHILPIYVEKIQNSCR